jgi:hypothetical protein
VHEKLDNPSVGLVLMGFSPPDRLAGLARHLKWPGLVLADPSREVYRALGLARAPLWRVYSPRTILTYARAARAGARLLRPVEDTRQLGGDAVVVDGSVVHIWRPRTPDDRPPVPEVLAAAEAQLGRGPV